MTSAFDPQSYDDLHEPIRPLLFPTTRRLLARVSKDWWNFVYYIGLVVQYTKAIVGYLFQGRMSWQDFYQQAAFVGIDTLGICLIMNTMTGMVIALQLATEMEKQGAGNFVGALVSLAMLRELAPIMTGFSVIAMAGSAYAAELSTMKITSQVDALRVLHIHPTRYLIVPRVVAGVFVLPLMTVITGYAGILGGLLISTLMTDVSAQTYLDSVWNQTSLKDIFSCLLKAGVFGYVIMMISTTVGINTNGGSREVGQATTMAVVWSFIMMAIMDFILTYIIYGTK